VAVKILVVDDSATMRKILEMTFAAENAEVIAVANGNAAVQAAQHSNPDLVFADASMDGMDGYAVAAAIKGNPALARTAVIVMASQKKPFDPAKGKSAGVDDHIVKPFDSQIVINKVAEVLGKPRAVATAAPAAPAPTAPGAGPAGPYRAPAVPAAPVAAARPPVAAHAAPVAHHTVPMAAAAPAARPPMAAAPIAPVARTSAPAPAPMAPTPVATAPAAAAPRAQKTTASFGEPAGAPRPSAGRLSEVPMELDEPGMGAPVRPAPASAAHAVTAPSGAMAGKLSALGLSSDQVAGVLALSREVIEQVVWEVVPELAETLIREEIKRLTAD